jgi:hypothetical protein
MELKAKVKLLEKQKAFLEQQAFVTDNKATIFNLMIAIYNNKRPHYPNYTSLQTKCTVKIKYK